VPRKKNKQDGQSGKNAPDHRVRRVEDPSEEAPAVFKMVKRSPVKPSSRRKFIRKVAGAAGVAAVGKLVTGCKSSVYGVEANEDTCTCHVVCSCDAEGKDASRYDNVYTEGVCTCNTVCTCHTVCTCNSEGGGGGGSTYWYPN
jgi:hypothetical protein